MWGWDPEEPKGTGEASGARGASVLSPPRRPLRGFSKAHVADEKEQQCLQTRTVFEQSTKRIKQNMKKTGGKKKTQINPNNNKSEGRRGAWLAQSAEWEAEHA